MAKRAPVVRTPAPATRTPKAVPTVPPRQATHIATGGTLPGACRVGDIYEKTGSSPGLYRCSATDTWSIVGGGGLSSPVGAADGGTGQTTPTADTVLVGDGSAWNKKTLPSCSSGTTDKLLYNSSTDAFSCGTDQTGAGALTQATLTLSDSDIKGMYNTPITVVAAPGANKVVVPVAVSFSTNFSAGAYGEGYSLNLYYGGVIPAVLNNVISQFNTTTRRQVHMEVTAQGIDLSTASNAALTVSNTTGSFTGGNAANSLKLVVIYYIADV